MMPRRARAPRYTDAEIDAAVAALSDPERLETGAAVVDARRAAAPARSSTQALEAGGWFGSAHEAAVLEAAGQPDPDERDRPPCARSSPRRRG